MKTISLSTVIISMLLINNAAYAFDDDKNNIEISVKGNLFYPPPCTISESVISVDLGDMITTEIDGDNYIRQIPMNIDCSAAKKDSLKLTFKGDVATGSGIPSGLLKTDYDQLGIRFKTGAGKNDAELGEEVKFDKTDVPDLWIVPVKIGTEEMTPRQITATATLAIEHD